MKLLFPLPNHYAVLRLNPEVMVRDLGLDDPETIAEVQAMKPQKYLVYLMWPGELPLPNRRWCRYSVSPIATTLRQVDKDKGITEDMVVPIYPNTQYTRPGHTPIHTTPAFPFPNCVHWIDNDIEVRIRTKPENYDHSHAVELAPAAYISLNRNFSSDLDRMSKLQENKHASGAVNGDTVPSLQSLASGTVQLLAEGDTELARIYRELVNVNSLSTSEPHEDAVDMDSSFNHSSDVPASMQTLPTILDDLFTMNIFGWNPDQTTALLPLVDVWLDLEEHMTADSIPSPVGLQHERQTILSCARCHFIVMTLLNISSHRIIIRGLERRLSTKHTNYHHSKEQHSEEQPNGFAK